MLKPSGDMLAKPEALILAPEAPYPPVGGGALRTASVIEYLRPRYNVEVVAFREPGRPDPRTAAPPDLLFHVIDLPENSRSAAARAARNLRRAVRGVPPLVDRFGGFSSHIREAIGSRRFDVGIVEHFWCAPYAGLLRPSCGRLILNLHNVESVLAQRQAHSRSGPVRLLAAWFASCYAALERRWLPLFDDLLVTSESDAELTGRGIVYPNAIPERPLPRAGKREEIAFSGNLEYEPNQTAIRWFLNTIWPLVRARRPRLTWRLIGCNESGVRRLLNGHTGVELSGPVEDAVAELARARAAVVPLLSGSGTRVKIIEAWAAGLPVISTSIGAEGLPCSRHKDLRIADTPEEFARAILEVLDSDALQQELGGNGRKVFEERLTWRAAWQVLEKTGL